MVHRSRLHVLLGVLLWVVFGYYWYLVVQRPITDHTRVALMAVGSIVAAISLFLAMWVNHNTRIARKLGRRKKRVSSVALPETDFLGRTFVASSHEQLVAAPFVEVHIIEMWDSQGSSEQKVFRVSDALSG